MCITEEPLILIQKRHSVFKEILFTESMKPKTELIAELKANIIGMILTQKVQELQANCGPLCDCVTCLRASEKHVAWCACNKCNTERREKGLAEIENTTEA